MALKPTRKFTDGTEIRYTMNETASRGIIVVHDSSYTGVGLDDSDARVRVPTGEDDGAVAGMLLNDVVSIDLTRYSTKLMVDEVPVSGKVTVGAHGWAETNMLSSGITPNGGDAAYYASGGYINTSGTKQVGKFLSGKDTDGYATVEVNSNI